MVFPMTGEPRSGPTTFAEPDENLGYAERAKRFYDNPPAAPGQPQFQYEGIGALPSMLGDIAHDAINNPGGMSHLYNAAEQQTRLADSINSNQLSVEEAYDRRIKMVKDATGVQLDNPERYRMTERERRQLNVQGVEPADVPTYQRKMFDAKTAELRDAHPDKIDQLTFGDINEEAKALAKGAEGEYEEARKDTTLSTPGSLVAQFGGGFQGSLRDPMVTGTMFAGPTTAAGKTVGARLLSAGFRQGLYNAGITALEQPAVQAWRSEIGVKSGVLPAVENVGMSFLFGAIPGAGFRLLHEIPGHLQPSVQRVLSGTPQTGDIEKALDAVNAALKEIDGDIKPRTAAPVQERAARLGADMDAAEQATKPPPPSPDIPPQLHDDLTQAALRHADDPSKPSPQAVAAVDAIEAWHGSPHDFESFDLSKIGTGEGAQSYGHGLYFAENKGVAESYRVESYTVNGRELNVENPHHRAASFAHDLGGEKALEYAKIERARDPSDYWDSVVRHLERGGLPEVEPGKPTPLYKVRIHADREHMLDWDKPLSEQTPEIQAKLKDLGFHMGAADVELALRSKATDLGGADKVSAALKEAGIPGIKYLDQGSRTALPAEEIAAQIKQVKSDIEHLDRNIADQSLTKHEQGLYKGQRIDLETRLGELEKTPDIASATSNFVIFDDKLIDITHKNDKPLHPVIQEVQQRIHEAQPQSRAEAEIAAHEALEDIGNRQANVRTREELAQPTLPERPPPVEGVKPPPASSKDPLDKIPWSDADGNAKMVSAQTAARAGERETKFADIIRECK